MFSPWALIPAFDAYPYKKFVIRHHFGNEGYEVQISDLQTIWVEKLDRKGVVHRSLAENSPIDASEDREQRQRLLDYIQAALNSQDGNRIRLLRLSAESIHIEAVSELPAAARMPPIRWPLKFAIPASATNTTVAGEIVAPLLSTTYVQKQQISRLVQLLEEKDAAIARILEQIESAGVDLSTVFPSAAAGHKGRITRAQAVQSVRGLAPFDKATLDKAVERDVSSSQESLNARIIIEDAFRTGDAAHLRTFSQIFNLISPDVSETPCSSDVSGLASTSILGSDQAAQKTRLSSKPTLRPASLSTRQQSTDDEDFQRQDTPPRPRLQAEPSARSQHNVSEPPATPSQGAEFSANVADDGDETTEDEEDLDAPYVPSKPPTATTTHNPVPSSPPTQKVEETPWSLPNPKAPASPIHDEEKTLDLDQPPPPLSSRPKSTLGSLRARAASPVPSLPQVQVPSSAPESSSTAPTSPPAPTARGRLGKLGARKAAVAVASESATATAPSTDPPVSSTPAARGSLGKLGARKAAVAAASSSSTAAAPSTDCPISRVPAEPPAPVRKRTASPAPEIEAKRETSVEAAERRRAELERELEAKRKAPPKKKRRF